MSRLIFILLFAISVSTPTIAADQYDLPKPVDIVMMAGADFNLNITHNDPTTGQPLNLTGAAFYSQFRSAPAPAGVVFGTFSTPIVSVSTGKSRVSMSKARTQALSGKSGIWDLLMINVSGLATYIMSGKAVVKPMATVAP